MGKAMDSLTLRQQLFVRYYAVHLEAAQAAKDAGYSPRRANSAGYNLLQKKRIQAAIQEHLQRVRDDIEISEAYVLRGLREVAERCLQKVPVRDKRGRPTGLYRFDAAGANKALENLGRHLGMFTDNLKVSDLDQVPDDELDAQLDELERKRKAATAANTH